MDWNEAIAAVTRVVEDLEHAGKPAKSVVAERTYDTTAADLWDALTTAERILRWFLPISGELRLGGRYQLEGNAGGAITHCEPPRHLGLTWEYAGETSWVDVRVRDAAGRAHLRFEHLAHADEVMWTKFGPGGVGVGWDLALLGLAKHIGGAPPTDPKQTALWLGSDEGWRFVAASNEAWSHADSAAGTVPDRNR